MSKQCTPQFKQITDYLHKLAIILIAIFSGIQISKLEKGEEPGYWVPLGLTLMMVLRLPNVICIALNDSHGWNVVAGTITALVTNAYLTHLIISKKNNDKSNHSHHHYHNY